jgi:hypothetical protein
MDYLDGVAHSGKHLQQQMGLPLTSTISFVRITRETFGSDIIPRMV